MDKLKFRQHLNDSLILLLDLTREFCYNEINRNFRFLIQPSGTDFHDGLNEFEKKNLTQLIKHTDKLLTEEQIVDLLWHDEKVPLWINTTVYECRPGLTVIQLIISRRLRPAWELFNKAVKYPPFNVLVSIPPVPLRKEIGGKFDVNWKKQLDERRKPFSIMKRIKQILSNIAT